jgi:hypothetical protein
MNGSGGQAMVFRLLAEQRKRCLATIMSNAESSTWWPSLTGAEQGEFREQVRHSLAVFYDLTRDVIKVTEDDTPRNELAIELITSMHTQQQKIIDHLAIKE